MLYAEKSLCAVVTAGIRVGVQTFKIQVWLFTST